jgi:hypothetical protein
MTRLAISTGNGGAIIALADRNRRMIMNKHTLRSAVLAMALTFGASATLTIGHALVAPTAAHAGIIGKIGSAVKSTAKRVGGAAKTVGTGAVHAGKAVRGGISGVGGKVKQGALKVGGVIAKSPPGKAVAKVGVKIGRKL